MNQDTGKASEAATAVNEFTSWLVGSIFLDCGLEKCPSKMLALNVRNKKVELFTKIFGRAPTTMEQDHLGTSV